MGRGSDTQAYITLPCPWINASASNERFFEGRKGRAMLGPQAWHGLSACPRMSQVVTMRLDGELVGKTRRNRLPSALSRAALGGASGGVANPQLSYAVQKRFPSFVKGLDLLGSTLSDKHGRNGGEVTTPGSGRKGRSARGRGGAWGTEGRAPGPERRKCSCLREAFPWCER